MPSHFYLNFTKNYVKVFALDHYHCQSEEINEKIKSYLSVYKCIYVCLHVFFLLP